MLYYSRPKRKYVFSAMVWCRLNFLLLGFAVLAQPRVAAALGRLFERWLETIEVVGLAAIVATAEKKGGKDLEVNTQK